ncbi:MAG: NAD(P)H-dependent oxidoreductase [Acidimicrobiia bacterium]|nr:NAD(P)H-dependent oxidoreductase [Acidimicrobiia bacterium]
MDIVAVIGNPNPGGRTTRVAEAVGAAIAAGADGEASVETIELAEVAPHLFEWGNEDVAALTARVTGADVVVAACPTYKATYTGLLKAFLDNYGNDGLAGCRAVPVMVGAAPNHALAPEVHLRPLLVELGASVPSRGLYVLESQVDDLDAVIGPWAEHAVPLLT